MQIQLNNFVSNTLKPFVSSLISNHSQAVTLAIGAISLFGAALYYLYRRKFKAKAHPESTLTDKKATASFNHIMFKPVEPKPTNQKNAESIIQTAAEPQISL